MLSFPSQNWHLPRGTTSSICCVSFWVHTATHIYLLHTHMHTHTQTPAPQGIKDHRDSETTSLNKTPAFSSELYSKRLCTVATDFLKSGKCLLLSTCCPGRALVDPSVENQNQDVNYWHVSDLCTCSSLPALFLFNHFL